MTNDELLLRIAQTLKQEIGPAVTAEYPKTQAFMAAVVLEKVGRELAAERAHAAARAADIAALLAALDDSALPVMIANALAKLAARRDEAALSQVVDAIYAARGELGEARFATVLGRVRAMLRASNDRRMEYAS